jgi:hypothetical protein
MLQNLIFTETFQFYHWQEPLSSFMVVGTIFHLEENICILTKFLALYLCFHIRKNGSSIKSIFFSSHLRQSAGALFETWSLLAHQTGDPWHFWFHLPD